MSAPPLVPVDFYFDVGSPYSYVATARVDDLRGATVRWRPFLLGGVFKASGNSSPAGSPAKARWMVADLARCAAAAGLPFRFASRFPLNTLRAQRALVAAEKAAGHDAMVGLARALFAAYWAEDRDVSDLAVIAAIADAAGLDGAALVEATGDQAVKDELRAITDAAVAAGAFGAPTFVVGGTLHWGHDRLGQVQAQIDAA